MQYDARTRLFLNKSKVDPLDRVDVEVGEHELLFKRWDNEFGFSFRLLGVGEAELRREGQMTKAISRDVDSYFYPVTSSPINPEGGHEFLIVLKRKPATNVLHFQVKSKGVDFWKQPKQSSERHFVPEHIKNSYAVYAHDRPTNWVGGKLYRCGKVSHIPRPYATDANGNRVWCELNIHRGHATITLPEDFWALAQYPIAVDPTFGKTTIGASPGTWLAGDIGGSWYQLTGSDGIVTKLTSYMSGVAGSTVMRYGFYNHNGTIPTTLIFGSSEITVGASAAGAWVDSNTAPNPINCNQNNYFYFGWMPGQAAGPNVFGDAGGTNGEQWWSDSLSYPKFRSPFVLSGQDNFLDCLYATYTSTTLGTTTVISPPDQAGQQIVG